MVDDFEAIEDLVDYIHLLDTNDKLYKQYLSFKDEPIKNDKLKQILLSRDWSPEFCNKSSKKSFGKINTQYNSIFTGYECFICNKVHNYLKTGGKLVFQVNSSAYSCPSPRRFDKNGQYSVHTEMWAAEWQYGKYEAKAMSLLYERGTTMTQREFSKFVKDTMNSNDD